MKVSIICPTYNEEKYIAQTIESFVAQEHSDFDLEILIVDGRSTDKTRAIVEQYQQVCSFLKLVDNPERKTPYAFNYGLKAATGEYVAILGAHTKYAKNYVQACLQAVLKHNVVGCTGRVITQALTNDFQSKICEWVMLSSFGVSRSSFRTMQEGYVHSVNFPVFKKQPLLDLGGYDVRFERNQDNDMNQRLLDAGHQLYCTWKTHCYYRPPSSIKKLLFYAERNGFWNARSVQLHAKSMRIHHLIPFFFVIGVIMGPVLGLFEWWFFKTSYLIQFWIAAICLHVLLGIIASIKSNQYNFDFRKIALPFIFFAFHFKYGWGTLKGMTNI